MKKTVKTPNTIITNLALEFILSHWYEIDKKKMELNISKAECIKTIKKDFSYASWIVAEVMDWGCATNYKKEYIVDYDDAILY